MIESSSLNFLLRSSLPSEVPMFPTWLNVENCLETCKLLNVLISFGWCLPFIKKKEKRNSFGWCLCFQPAYSVFIHFMFPSIYNVSPMVEGPILTLFECLSNFFFFFHLCKCFFDIISAINWSISFNDWVAQLVSSHYINMGNNFKRTKQFYFYI